MFAKAFLFLALSGATCALSATSGFLLGRNYSEWFYPSAYQLAADGAGDLYVLAPCSPTDFVNSCITKLSPDGKVILWQQALGFRPQPFGFSFPPMAVDPDGEVFVLNGPSVEKLSGDGTQISWQKQFDQGSVAYALAVDSAGRAVVAGETRTGLPYVMRLTPTGAIDYNTTLNFPLYSGTARIGADAAGEVALVSRSSNGPVLAWLSPSGVLTSQTTLPASLSVLGFAVAPNGDALVITFDLQQNLSLEKIQPSGAVVFSNAIETQYQQASLLAVDAAGNAYITGTSGSLMHPVKNSLAPCGYIWLSVFAPDGSVLQNTYIPGSSDDDFSSLIATGPNSNVFVVIPVNASFVPYQPGPLAEAGTVLFRFAPDPSAQIVPLACVGSSASYDTGAIAPGEMVTLMGTGIGPQQGVQTQASPQSPFPTEASNVVVTFDGKPAPLLWVQDSQVNVVVPWSVSTAHSTEVCVTYNSPKGSCLIWPVAQTAPGVFTVDGTHAAAINQDGTLNSAEHPAPWGSIITIYVTGLGPITPAQDDGTLVGLPLPVNVVPMVVDAIWSPGIPGLPLITPLNVTYAGPAPDAVAGVTQIDFEAIPYDGQIYVSITDTTGSQGFDIYLANQ